LTLLTHQGEKLQPFIEIAIGVNSFQMPSKIYLTNHRHHKLTVYVDADHARNNVTRRSVTGILPLINNTPLVWISKQQRTVETSIFGTEMIAARMAIDLIIEMRYKLRCLGIPVEKRSELLGDNLSVVVNTTLLLSKIKKMHLSCQIMRVREAIAAGFV
jgi:hypothetical protein